MLIACWESLCLLYTNSGQAGFRPACKESFPLHAFINRDITHSKKITAVFAVFVLTQCITMFTDRVTTGSLITVAFMFVEIVVFLIMQRDEEITEESLEWFGKMLIMVGIVMGLYSILFKTGRFVRAFTNPNAYNSECKSFLYSNHEYALYLSVSIIFAAWMQFTFVMNVY